MGVPFEDKLYVWHGGRQRVNPAVALSIFADSTVKHVLVFGSVGQGKSALINVLTGAEIAPSSNSAMGVSFDTTPYLITHNNQRYIMYDTAGLNEASFGTVTASQAFENLVTFLKHTCATGINLAILVHQKRLVESNFDANYRMLVEGLLAGSGIPVLLVKNGCESSESLDGWKHELANVTSKYPQSRSATNQQWIDEHFHEVAGDKTVCACCLFSKNPVTDTAIAPLRTETHAKVWAAIAQHSLDQSKKVADDFGSFVVKVWNKTLALLHNIIPVTAIRNVIEKITIAKQSVVDMLLRMGMTKKAAQDTARKITGFDPDASS